MELVCPCRIGAGAHGHDDVLQVDVGLNGAGRADAHNVLHAERVVQLMGIDADGGHTHTGGHDGDPNALIGAGVALHAADVVDKDRIFQKMFRNVFGAQRIARHEHGLAEIGRCSLNMWSRIIHGGSPFIRMF